MNIQQATEEVRDRYNRGRFGRLSYDEVSPRMRDMFAQEAGLFRRKIVAGVTVVAGRPWSVANVSTTEILSEHNAIVLDLGTRFAVALIDERGKWCYLHAQDDEHAAAIIAALNSHAPAAEHGEESAFR